MEPLLLSICTTGSMHEMELSVFMKAFLLLIMVPIEIIRPVYEAFCAQRNSFVREYDGWAHRLVLLAGLTFLFHSLLVGAFVTVPFALLVYFLEIFVAVLQAYIFTTLSAVLSLAWWVFGSAVACA